MYDLYNKILSKIQAASPSLLHCPASLRIIIEQSIEMNAPLFLIPIAFDTSFNNVDPDSISQCLEKIGTDKDTIRQIHYLFNDGSRRICSWNKIWQSSEIKEKLGIEICLLRVISLLVLHYVLEKINVNAEDGILWEGKELHYLIFEDQICLMAKTVAAIQSKVEQVALHACEAGLKIDKEETKVMRISTNNTTPVKLKDVILRDVGEICYLGSIFSKNVGISADVTKGMLTAKNNFSIFRRYLKSSKYSTEEKMKFFNRFIKSGLLYGCETWIEPKRETKRLQKFINNCLRVMLQTRVAHQRELLTRCNEDPQLSPQRVSSGIHKARETTDVQSLP
ncbi:uncharacterized protein LOC101892895 isoform X2 [Musca domestica]|nr:uncharacterized protein LOC101892895 isoform X2 [Musca domestica]XP_058980708.1 uncharacterized protein LOC101892895 isoform X2 [Musca domestica]